MFGVFFFNILCFFSSELHEDNNSLMIKSLTNYLKADWGSGGFLPLVRIFARVNDYAEPNRGWILALRLTIPCHFLFHPSLVAGIFKRSPVLVPTTLN